MVKRPFLRAVLSTVRKDSSLNREMRYLRASSRKVGRGKGRVSGRKGILWIVISGPGEVSGAVSGGEFSVSWALVVAKVRVKQMRRRRMSKGVEVEKCSVEECSVEDYLWRSALW